MNLKTEAARVAKATELSAGSDHQIKFMNINETGSLFSKDEVASKKIRDSI